MSKGGIGNLELRCGLPGKNSRYNTDFGPIRFDQDMRVKNIPTWVFHGDGDALVTPKKPRS